MLVEVEGKPNADLNSTMNWEKLNKATILPFRAGVSIGVGVLLYMQGQYVPRREYEVRWASHDKIRDDTLNMLLKSVDRLENQAIRIEAKIDRQANIRADAGAAVGKRANP